MRKQSLFYLFPIKTASFGRKSVINSACCKKQSFFLKFPVVIAFFIHCRPYRDHEMNPHVMEFVYHVVRIGKTGGIETFLSPEAVRPAHPVQNKRIQSDLPSAEFFRRCQQVLGVFIAFFRLHIAKGPFGKQSRASRQLSDGGGYFAGRFGRNKIIVQVGIGFCMQIGTVLRVVKNGRTLRGEQDSPVFVG